MTGCPKNHGEEDPNTTTTMATTKQSSLSLCAPTHPPSIQVFVRGSTGQDVAGWHLPLGNRGTKARGWGGSRVGGTPQSQPGLIFSNPSTIRVSPHWGQLWASSCAKVMPKARSISQLLSMGCPQTVGQGEPETFREEGQGCGYTTCRTGDPGERDGTGLSACAHTTPWGHEEQGSRRVKQDRLFPRPHTVLWDGKPGGRQDRATPTSPHHPVKTPGGGQNRAVPASRTALWDRHPGEWERTELSPRPRTAPRGHGGQASGSG